MATHALTDNFRIVCRRKSGILPRRLNKPPRPVLGSEDTRIEDCNGPDHFFISG